MSQLEELAAGLSQDNKRQTVVLESCLKRIAELEAALSGVVKHWREFGGMMVYDNATNRDDYGLDERIEAVAKLIEK